MAAGGVINTSAFLFLSTDSSSMSGNFDAWLDEFRLSIEFKSLDMDPEEVTSESSSRTVSKA